MKDTKQKLKSSTKIMTLVYIAFILLCGILVGISFSALTSTRTATGTITFALTNSPEMTLNLNFIVGTENQTFLGTTTESPLTSLSDVLRVNIKDDSALSIQITFDNNEIYVPSSLSVATNNGVALTKTSNANGVAVFESSANVSSGDYVVLDKLLSAIYPTSEIASQNYEILVTSQASGSAPATAKLSGIYYVHAWYNVTIAKNEDYGTLSETLLNIPYNSTYTTSGNILTFKDYSGITLATITATPYETTSQYIYSFDSWSSTSGTITSTTSIQANFTRIENGFTFTWTDTKGYISSVVDVTNDNSVINNGGKVPSGHIVAIKHNKNSINDFTLTDENGDNVDYTWKNESCDGDLISFTMPSLAVNYTVTGYMPGPCCVSADTLITMADGMTKRADEIEIGDKIISYNFETGELEEDTITELLQRDRKELITINFKDGTSIKITNDHPLFTESGWKAYDAEFASSVYGDLGIESKFELGDKLFSTTKYFDKEIVSIYYEECEEENYFATYQFKTEKNRNFFANEVLSSAL